MEEALTVVACIGLAGYMLVEFTLTGHKLWAAFHQWLDKKLA